MQRTVTTPADLTGAALDELKGWLGISRPRDDALLVDLLGASVALCEAFTGQAPIEQTVEETIPAPAGQYVLSTRPVRALLTAELVEADGTRTAFDQGAYIFEIDAAQTACITIESAPDAQAIVVSMRAGIAADWRSLPEALRQGMIRLAAFHYRDRESGRDADPPASVAALWRPWRILRLA